MSAYIVSEDHINVIVSYFVDHRHGEGLWHKLNDRYDSLTMENAPAVAYELYRENVRSVNGRYNDTNSDEMYQFKYLPHVKDVYTEAEIAGALDGLEYQSCESDDYQTTEAYGLLNAMRKNLLSRIASRELGDETVWSIDEVKPAEKVYL